MDDTDLLRLLGLAAVEKEADASEEAPAQPELAKNVAAWNAWRAEDHSRTPRLRGVNLSACDLRGANLDSAFLEFADLSGSDLSHASLRGAFLSEANLESAKLEGANLFAARMTQTKLKGAILWDAKLAQANLRQANLGDAEMIRANLEGTQFLAANLEGASLRESNLTCANFTASILRGVDLTGALLVGCTFMGTDIDGATFQDNCVYGISAWDLRGTPKRQERLSVTLPRDSPVLVDELKVAQFIYLLLDNRQLREVIDTVTSKVVLILGNFSAERRPFLEAVSAELRRCDHIPVLFTFQGPSHQDKTATVETLARLAKFVIADTTDPRSVPHELATIVPFLRTTPVMLLRLAGARGYSMVDNLKSYPWVCDVGDYSDEKSLVASLRDLVEKATVRADELRKR